MSEQTQLYSQVHSVKCINRMRRNQVHPEMAKIAFFYGPTDSRVPTLLRLFPDFALKILGRTDLLQISDSFAIFTDFRLYTISFVFQTKTQSKLKKLSKVPKQDIQEIYPTAGNYLCALFLNTFLMYDRFMFRDKNVCWHKSQS
eukprot:TRINITY_DN871_c0_g1_i7.p4 TRINITY_DN871_c0_g1~~TRINITY_DN871_c0_g1_i7.p4  ORF type:complete len:144 (-),score=2.83 TRINITY_DN871_c0_g1_i7:5-436(-)